MNILFINEFQANETQGGVQRVTRILADYFIKKGFEVFYLFYKQYSNEQIISDNEYQFSDYKISSQNNKKLIDDIIYIHNIDIIINQMGFSREMVKVLSSLNFKKPFLSCLHSDPCYEMRDAEIQLSNSIKLKYRFILNLKILFKPLYFILLKMKISRKLRFIYLNSTNIILLSNSFKQSFLQISKTKESSKLKAIGNPLDPKFKYYKSLKLSNKEKKVLFVGRLNKGKRVDLLLEMWKQIQLEIDDWNFSIVGDGSELTNLKELSIKLNLKNITFWGKSDDVEHHYQSSSIFVSMSAFEGFPMVLIEAQMFGTIPIVYNTYESVTDVIINNETGFIIPDLNQQLFVNKLKQLMQSDEKRNRMAKKAVEFTEKFDIERIGENWVDLINHVSNK